MQVTVSLIARARWRPPVRWLTYPTEANLGRRIGGSGLADGVPAAWPASQQAISIGLEKSQIMRLYETDEEAKGDISLERSQKARPF